MKFTLPETLPDALDKLVELRDKGIESLSSIMPGDGVAPDAETLEQMRYIDKALDSLESRIDEIQAEETQRAEEAAAIQGRRLDRGEDNDTPDTPDNEGDDGDEGDEGDDPETTSGATTEPTQDDAETNPAESESSIAVSARRRHRFAGHTRRDTPPAAKPTFGYTLDGDVRNYIPGYVDSMTVARAFADATTGRAHRRVGSRMNIAAFNRPELPTDHLVTDEFSALDVIDRATNEKKLKGGSLVAAGGWCAPSETVYDFLGTPDATNLLDLPEIGVKRGGIKFPVEPDFSTIYTDFPGFYQTEAQAQSGTVKPCQEIPCGEFEELRLDVIGLCITSGILQEKAWPEMIKKYTDELMRAHQHRLSRHKIDKIVAGSTTVTFSTGLIGAAGAVLNSIELAAIDIRTKHRIEDTVTIEGMAPVWLRDVIRADLAYRDNVLPTQVSNQLIDSHFAERGIRLQFVVDWQDDVIGAATAATAYPGEVKVALWPAGTWYTALEPVIHLGATYDKAQLERNMKTLMFTEDGIAVGKRGPESRVLTIPIKVNGQVGTRVEPTS